MPRTSRRHSLKARLVGIAIVGVMLTGCSVSKSMRIRTGEDPVHKDDDVRFRTTYYFRVFDACEGVAETENASGRGDTVLRGFSKGPYHLRTDSLYRFRMTGKAYALFSRVHFESGTLRKQEIDPFGSNVVFDSKTNRFAYKSREDTEQDVRREARFVDIQRLMAFKETLKGNPGALKAIDDIILKQIGGLAPMDLLPAGDIQRGLTAMPGLLAEFARDHERAVRLRDEGIALRSGVTGVAAVLETAKKPVTEAATKAYGDFRARYLAIRAELDAAVGVPDTLLSGTPEDLRARARDAIDRLKQSTARLKLADLPADKPAPDDATESAMTVARQGLERVIVVSPTVLGDVDVVVAVLDRLRGASNLAAVVDKVVEAHQAALALRGKIEDLRARAGSALPLQATAVSAVKNLRALTDAVAAAQEIGRDLNPPVGDANNLDKQAGAAASGLEGVAKSAAEAAGDANATATALREKREGKEEARKYGETAAKLAGQAATAQQTVKSTAQAFHARSTGASAAVLVLAGAEPTAGGALDDSRRAMGGLVDQLVRLAKSWGELRDSVAEHASGATQIAATMSLASRAGGAGTPGPPSAVEILPCPRGTTARRGFQILGPEGWRTFDQDERLVMAMSSSAKPLLGALQEISRNVLNAQQGPAEALLPLVKERLRIFETDRKAERYERTGGTVDAILEDLLTTFGRTAGSEGNQ